MSLRPTQSSRGHDAGSHSTAQAALAPVVTAAAGAVAQGPHVSAAGSGGQANKDPSAASGAAGPAGPMAGGGGGGRKRELSRSRWHIPKLTACG